MFPAASISDFRQGLRSYSEWAFTYEPPPRVAPFAAAFQQNSLQRVRAGDEAEVAFDAVPGRVFKGKVRLVLDAIAAGQIRPTGALVDFAERTEGGRALAVIDITDMLNGLISQHELVDGLCNVFVIHTTAALTTADLDPGTDQDMLDAFSAMAPKLHYRHPHNPEHAPDHILASMIGPSIIVPVEGGSVIRQRFAHVPSGLSTLRLAADGGADAEAIVSWRRGDLRRGMEATLAAIKATLERA